MNYYNKLRDTRTQEGLKLTELSRLCGVSEKTIRDIEKGKCSSTQVTKQKILKGLNNHSLRSKVWSYEEIFGKGSADENIALPLFSDVKHGY